MTDQVDPDILDQISQYDEPMKMSRLWFESKRLNPKSILVSEDRQRKMEDVPQVDQESLIQSIYENGLIHPIVVDDADYSLLAGGRRLEAWKALIRRGAIPEDQQEIPVRLMSDLDPNERIRIELEENIKRKNLTWQEDALAHLQYHESLTKSHIQNEVYDDPEWQDEWTADNLGLNPSNLSKRLTVAKALLVDEDIRKCDNLTAAYSMLDRRRSRAVESELLDMSETEIIGPDIQAKAPATGAPVAQTQPEKSKLDSQVDGMIWHGKWPDIIPQFAPNLIHCDFPYGIDLHKSDQMNMAAHETSYDDSPEIYFGLTRYLFEVYVPNAAAEQCHVLFWYPFKYHNETLEIINGANAEYRVDPYPLVWHKEDGVGIVPDARRGPRRTYETALLVSKGDRQIVTPVANSVSAPRASRAGGHTSQKPHGAVYHFLRMLVDGSTRIFDPTCGSGTALAAAWQLGARVLFALDINADAVDEARLNLKRAIVGTAGQDDDDNGIVVGDVADLSLEELDL